MRVLTVVLLAWLIRPASLVAQDAPLTLSELHQRLVQVFSSVAHRPLPAGDTLVTWSPNPTLMTTASREEGRIASSLIRADGMNGTADAHWGDGAPATVHVLWTRPDTILVDLEIVRQGETIRFSGTSDSVMTVPTEPWAIADYGMEDQLLPLIARLPDGESIIQVFRPYGRKWDRLSLTVQDHGSFKLVERREAGEASPTFYWEIGPTGGLIRITRDDFPDTERRPLEGSVLYAEYVDLVRGGGAR